MRKHISLNLKTSEFGSFLPTKLSGAVKRCFKGLAFQELGLAPAPFSGQHRADESASPPASLGALAIKASSYWAVAKR